MLIKVIIWIVTPDLMDSKLFEIECSLSKYYLKLSLYYTIFNFELYQLGVGVNCCLYVGSIITSVVKSSYNLKLFEIDEVIIIWK